MNHLIEEAGLTRRETQTLTHLMTGLTERAVAKRMRLSAATIHTYVKGIYRKFGVESKPKLFAKFFEAGGIKIAT